MLGFGSARSGPVRKGGTRHGRHGGVKNRHAFFSMIETSQQPPEETRRKRGKRILLKGEKRKKPGPPKKKPHYTQIVGNKGNKVGQKYDPSVHVELAELLAMLELSDLEIGAHFKITPATFNSWYSKHKQFAEAVDRGRLPSAAKAVGALFKRVMGFEYNEDEYVRNVKTNEMVLVGRKRKFVAPDVGAIMQFLRHKTKGKWSDKSTVELTGASGSELKPLIIAVGFAELPQAKGEPKQVTAAAPVIDIPGKQDVKPLVVKIETKTVAVAVTAAELPQAAVPQKPDAKPAATLDDILKDL